jgi:hypothetical protein
VRLPIGAVQPYRHEVELRTFPRFEPFDLAPVEQTRAILVPRHLRVKAERVGPRDRVDDDRFTAAGGKPADFEELLVFRLAAPELES